jgi:uncharacterized protein (UPF0276 family)
MDLTINYSSPAAALLAEERIEIDRFKSPDWPDLIEKASALRPVAVHFDLKAGQDVAGQADWEQIEALLEQTGTPYVNLHLAPLAAGFPGIHYDQPFSRLAQQAVDQMLQDVMLAVRRFGPERVIVENSPYRGVRGSILRAAVEPEVICRIVDEAGCGLLLDISHARISAHYLEMDEREYLTSLPVHRLRELHFTGVHTVDGLLQDHLPILPADWRLLKWVVERIQRGEWSRPWMLAFEYGGVGGPFEGRSNPAVIAEQAPQLYEMVKFV